MTHLFPPLIFENKRQLCRVFDKIPAKESSHQLMKFRGDQFNSFGTQISIIYVCTCCDSQSNKFISKLENEVCVCVCAKNDVQWRRKKYGIFVIKFTCSFKCSSPNDFLCIFLAFVLTTTTTTSKKKTTRWCFRQKFYVYYVTFK